MQRIQSHFFTDSNRKAKPPDVSQVSVSLIRYQDNCDKVSPVAYKFRTTNESLAWSLILEAGEQKRKMLGTASVARPEFECWNQMFHADSAIRIFWIPMCNVKYRNVEFV